VREGDLPARLLHPLPGEEQIPGGLLRREGEEAGRGNGEEALRRRDPVPGGPRVQSTGMTTVTGEGLPWGTACAIKLSLKHSRKG